MFCAVFKNCFMYKNTITNCYNKLTIIVVCHKQKQSSSKHINVFYFNWLIIQNSSRSCLVASVQELYGSTARQEKQSTTQFHETKYRTTKIDILSKTTKTFAEFLYIASFEIIVTLNINTELQMQKLEEITEEKL